MRIVALVLVLLTLSACSSKAALVEPAPLDPDAYNQLIADAQRQQDEQAKQKQATDALLKKNGAYMTYRDGVIGQGKPVLLFFYASWDPFSEDNHQLLSDLYRKHPYAIFAYRIDYDTELTLKQTYNILTQDTFVLLDEQGRVVDSKIHPSRDELEALLMRYTAL